MKTNAFQQVARITRAASVSAIALAALAAASTLFAPAAFGASDSWNVDANGNYTDTANWLGGVVPGVAGGTGSADVATFSYSLTDNRTVTLGSIYAIGTLQFGNTSNRSYTITGSTFRIGNGGVIESVAGTGAHIDAIASTINLRGTGNSVITIRNNSTDGGLKIDGDITSAVSAGKVFTLILDGSNTKAGIGANAINNTIAGNIGDDADGDVAVVKNGAGLWTLTGANAFAGGLTFNQGTLRYFGTNTYFGVGGINVAGDGVVFTHANSTPTTIANNMSVSANFSMAGSDNTLWSGNWDLNGATREITVTANSTISGVISNGALGKLGGDVLDLTGNNTYSGGTTVNAGTLRVNNTSGSGTGSGTVTVAAAGTLGGNGTISGAVNVDGTLAAGNSIGVLNTGALSMNGTSVLDVELGRDTGTPVSDRVNVTGSVSIASGADLKLTLYTGLTTPVLGDIFYLISNDDTDVISGVFTKLNGATTALTEGSTFNWNSLDWTITYLANFEGSAFTGGNDLAIKVIPEPTALAMMLGGVGMLALLRRRR
jgi:autotransporter-associated beta strand protein